MKNIVLHFILVVISVLPFFTLFSLVLLLVYLGFYKNCHSPFLFCKVAHPVFFYSKLLSCPFAFYQISS